MCCTETGQILNSIYYLGNFSYQSVIECFQVSVLRNVQMAQKVA